MPAPGGSPTTPNSGQEIVVGNAHILPKRIELGAPPAAVRDPREFAYPNNALLTVFTV